MAAISRGDFGEVGFDRDSNVTAAFLSGYRGASSERCAAAINRYVDRLDDSVPNGQFILALFGMRYAVNTDDDTTSKLTQLVRHGTPSEPI
ncbi:MAG: hypothetical protein ABI859_00135 [Pseudomonadota bacterium]